MKQIEITVRVNDSLKKVSKNLEKQGFKKIRESRIEDKYLTQNKKKISKKNIIDVLKSCVLVRYLRVNNEQEFKKITYKCKEYKDDTVISETKINVSIDDTSKAEELFKKLGFNTLVEVNYDVIVYEKDGLELAFQEVEGLGLLLEYENTKDFSGIDDKEILKEKEKMAQEIKKFNINIGDDYDIKKAYELVLNNITENK